jgi:thiamine-phosphate pyrophosphorylase
VIAIGGINRRNVREVIAAGADGIAVISAVVASPDIAAAARDLKDLVRESKRSRGR